MNENELDTSIQGFDQNDISSETPTNNPNRFMNQTDLDLALTMEKATELNNERLERIAEDEEANAELIKQQELAAKHENENA